jgi:hypothetical protein
LLGLLAGGCFLGVVSQVQAETVISEEPPVSDAVKIPSRVERGYRALLVAEPAGVITNKPLAMFEELYPFIGDAKVSLHLRNYYLTRSTFDNEDVETWAQGGWLRITTGEAWDFLSFGATVYGSYRLYGPEDKEGAKMLQPGQKNITVPGELYAKLRAFGYEAKLGRQEYNMPFVNRQDIRMIPLTFEGYHIAATAKDHPRLQYGVGYVDKIKKRDTDEFIKMSDAAGAPDGLNCGAWMGGVRYLPLEHLSLESFDVYTPDVINIFYGEIVTRFKTESEVGIKLSGQFIHQAGVGDEVLERVNNSTHALGGKAELSYDSAVVTLALTGNSRDENMLYPYGTYGGYNSMIYKDYERAGECALRLGLSYDLEKIGFEGWSCFGNYVWGANAVDPKSREDVPNQDELDLTVEYNFKRGIFKGLSIRGRAALIDEEGGRSLADYRIISNYTF